ncbi:MAG: adenylyltransferase/cytidyltransferase family protein [Acidimicrobiales bacterium]
MSGSGDDRPVLVIISGYFSPLHAGHLDMIEAGDEMGDVLAVIVNNNAQQTLKKGKVIIDQADRLRVVQALRAVDDALIAVDDDATVSASLEVLARRYPDHRLIFGNGGDRTSDAVVPESAVCETHNIEMIFDLGGATKHDSSSRINQELGYE